MIASSACSSLGSTSPLAALQVLNSSSPAVSYVVTPNWLLNWFLPTRLPRHLVDKEIARRFSLHRCARGQVQPDGRMHTEGAQHCAVCGVKVLD